jgi:hypothetical protein
MEPEDTGFVDESGNDIAAQAEQNEYEALIGLSLTDILREGQKALFARLVGRCRLGTASHQELAILRNVLKDQGLTLGITPEGAPTSNMIGHNAGPPLDMPSFDPPDYDN